MRDSGFVQGRPGILALKLIRLPLRATTMTRQKNRNTLIFMALSLFTATALTLAVTFA